MEVFVTVGGAAPVRKELFVLFDNFSIFEVLIAKVRLQSFSQNEILVDWSALGKTKEPGKSHVGKLVSIHYRRAN